jgi:hypothetical protein
LPSAIFFNEKHCLQKKRLPAEKSICLQKKHLPADKSICLQKKRLMFACKKKRLPAIFFVPAILSKADINAQQALI